MKNLIFSFLLVLNFVVFSQDTSTVYVHKTFEREMLGSHFYVEKFAPIYNHNLASNNLGTSKDGNFDKFNLIKDTYNKVWRKSWNDSIKAIIKRRKNTLKCSMIYSRDFNESCDSNYRYIIKCEFSPNHLYLHTTGAYYEDIYNGFVYYLYDKQTNKKYTSYRSLEKTLYAINKWISLSNKESLSDEEVESKLFDILYGNEYRFSYSSSEKSGKKKGGTGLVLVLLAVVTLLVISSGEM